MLSMASKPDGQDPAAHWEKSLTTVRTVSASRTTVVFFLGYLTCALHAVLETGCDAINTTVRD